MNGEPHDDRAPDYDDWSTPTDDKHKGLNGDILFWNSVVKTRHEVSQTNSRNPRISRNPRNPRNLSKLIS